jgi:cytochrome c biogenesis protein CcmG/thiol:disulfide interchange protein DsbE
MTTASPAPMTPPPVKKSRGIFVGIAFIAGVFIFAATFALIRHFEGTPYDALRPESERTAAALVMPTLDHHPWSLADHAGRVVLINYFATWCVPCIEETPDLVKIAKDYGGELDVVAVSLDQDSDQPQPRTQRLEGFITTYHIPFPILLPAADSPIFNQTFPIPQTTLIDRHGRTARTILGGVDVDTLRKSIQELIKEN